MNVFFFKVTHQLVACKLSYSLPTTLIISHHNVYIHVHIRISVGLAVLSV